MIKKIRHMLVFVIASIICVNRCLASSNDVAEYENGFICVGDNGKVQVTVINEENEEIDTGFSKDLFCILKTDSGYHVGGQDGLYLISNDGTLWEEGEYSFEDDIIDIEAYLDNIFFVCRNGAVYQKSENSKLVEKLDDQLDDDTVGMAECKYGAIIAAKNSTYLYFDGSDWEKHDYNEEYKKYSSEIVVTASGSTDHELWLLGYEKKTMHPVAITTVDGHTWSTVNMKLYDGDGNAEYVDEVPTGMIYNKLDEQVLITLDKGDVLTVSGCNKCNMLTKVSDNSLSSGMFFNGYIYLFGKQSFSKIIDCFGLRQNSMSPEKAVEEVDEGGIIIDVRSKEEYLNEHIENAYHIAFENLEEELPSLVTDKQNTILFYCSKGIRSRKAALKALDMGYMQAYSIGSISDWPYGIVKGE